MDLRLILIIASAAFTTVNAQRNLYNKMTDVNSKRDSKPLEKRPIFIEGQKSDLIPSAHMKIISQINLKLENKNHPAGKHTYSKRRIPRIEMPNKMIKEIRFKDTNAKHPIVQFKGYTTVPQKEKVIIRRHACNRNKPKRLFRTESLRELGHKYVRSNDYSEDEVINTETPFLTLSPWDRLENVLTKSKEAAKQNDLRSLENKLSSDVRKYDSGESEDQKEYIFVNVPQIAFEYVDNRNGGKKRNVIKHYGLFKRSVIEEESQATNAPSYRMSSTDTVLINNLDFKNINV